MVTVEDIDKGVSMLQKIGETAAEYLVKYGFQVLGGLIILFVGLNLANWVARIFTRFCEKKHMDVTLTKFLAGIIKVLILVFVAIVALEKFGVTISPFIAAASALIFGASFAIQAPLSNYAAGLSVILTRPFVVGNTISVQNVSGVVEEVKLACTILSTEDGERITIPNKDIVGQILWNSKEFKVVEVTIGISYGDDPEKAMQVIRDALRKFPNVRQTPPPQIGIESFGDSAINIGLRYWVPTKEHRDSLHAANLGVYRALQNAKISIPFPQREVRMVQTAEFRR